MCTLNNRLNLESVQVVLAGNFEPVRNEKGEIIQEGDRATQKQAEVLKGLIDRLARRYSIAPEGILRHSEASPDKCPGGNLQTLIEKIKDDLRQP